MKLLCGGECNDRVLAKEETGGAATKAGMGHCMAELVVPNGKDDGRIS